MKPGDLVIFERREVFARDLSWFQGIDFSSPGRTMEDVWFSGQDEPVILIERVTGTGHEIYFLKILTAQGIAFCRDTHYLSENVYATG